MTTDGCNGLHMRKLITLEMTNHFATGTFMSRLCVKLADYCMFQLLYLFSKGQIRTDARKLVLMVSYMQL